MMSAAQKTRRSEYVQRRDCESTLDIANDLIEAWESRLPETKVPEPYWLQEIRSNVVRSAKLPRSQFPGVRFASLIGTRAVCGPSRYDIMKQQYKEGRVEIADAAWGTVLNALENQARERREKKRRHQAYLDHLYYQ